MVELLEFDDVVLSVELQHLVLFELKTIIISFKFTCRHIQFIIILFLLAIL